jgi:DNA-binding beta-propeller fold protein YncE
MLKTQTILFSLILTGLVSCHKSNSDNVVLGFEKDLFPEGIAIDAKTERVFLNSLNYDKIVSVNFDGSSSSNFIEKNQFNYLSGFGMEIKGDTLYALGNSLTRKKNKSILILLNTKTKQVIDKYTSENDKVVYLNDLAVSKNNEIFMTDSESNKIYKIQRPNGKLEVYLDSEEINRSNGITISDDNARLYVASTKGIRIIDIKTKHILNQANKDFSGIDGLKFYKNTLIGIVNVWNKPENKNGVFRYFLNEKGDAISKKEKIIGFDNSFQLPTTFDIVGNHIYFIKNTQIDNFNDSTKQVIDKNLLKSYILLKKRID